MKGGGQIFFTPLIKKSDHSVHSVKNLDYWGGGMGCLPPPPFHFLYTPLDFQYKFLHFTAPIP